MPLVWESFVLLFQSDLDLMPFSCKMHQFVSLCHSYFLLASQISTVPCSILPQEPFHILSYYNHKHLVYSIGILCNRSTQSGAYIVWKWKENDTWFLKLMHFYSALFTVIPLKSKPTKM